MAVMKPYNVYKKSIIIYVMFKQAVVLPVQDPMLKWLRLFHRPWLLTGFFRMGILC